MVELMESAPEATPTGLASAHDSQGRAYHGLGRYEAALAARRKSLQTYEEKLGPDTPRAIRTRMGLSEALSELGRADEALDEARNAVQAADRALGPKTQLAARARGVLAIASASAGRLSESEQLFKECAATLELVLGDDHQDVAAVWMNLARVLTGLQRPADSLEALERARDIYDRALPKTHPDLLFFFSNLAEAQIKLERFPDALVSANRALSIARENYDETSSKTARAKRIVGVALLGNDRADEAVTMLKGAVEDLVDATSPPPVIAEARFDLARAQLAAGDPEPAVLSARTARVEFERLGEHPYRIEKIDAWLATIPPAR